MTSIKTAVFPVGGAGTRFLPATKSIPKEMLPILDKPLIQHSVEEARAAGIEKFIFVTGRGKEAIENHFDRDFALERHLEQKNHQELVDLIKEISLDPGQVIYLRQPEPLGLGHAIGCAAPWIQEPAFAVLLPDDFIQVGQSGCPPVLSQMCDMYDHDASPVMAAVMTVTLDEVSSYGILDVNPPSEATAPSASMMGSLIPTSLVSTSLISAKGLVEKPSRDTAPSCEAIIGRYILPSAILPHLLKGQIGSGGEIQITDAMAALIPTHGFYGFRFKGTRYDCGHHLGWLSANIAEGLSRPHLAEKLRQTLNGFTKDASSPLHKKDAP